LFFRQNPVASDFAPGTVFNFSTCLLEGITDSVRNAIPIQRGMFPHGWMAPLLVADPYSKPPVGPPPGLPPTCWELAPGPPRALAPPQRRSGQEDIRHPKIKQLMDPYLKWYNNYVNIADILTASGKRMTDLPTLPKYCHPTGQSFLCWNCMLGRCFHGPQCWFARGHSTDAFANGVTDVISKGVLYYTNPKGNEKAWGQAPLRIPD
jgi:hypothetical protein